MYITKSKNNKRTLAMCVYVQWRRDIDEGDSWRWNILVVSSPRSSMSRTDAANSDGSMIRIWDCLHSPVTAYADLDPLHLCGVIHCECRVQGKKCSTEVCGCDKEYRSCMSYNNCSDEDGCSYPYTNTEEA